MQMYRLVWDTDLENATQCVDYTIGSFDLVPLLCGRRAMSSITSDFRLIVRKGAITPDLIWAPTSLYIVSARLYDLLIPWAGGAYQDWLAPLFDESGRPIDGFYIFHPLASVDCIDWSDSELIRSRDGKLLAITRLVLVESAVAGHHLFRPRGYEISIVVSEEVATSVRASSANGVAFQRCQLSR